MYFAQLSRSFRKEAASYFTQAWNICCLLRGSRAPEPHRETSGAFSKRAQCRRSELLRNHDWRSRSGGALFAFALFRLRAPACHRDPRFPLLSRHHARRSVKWAFGLPIRSTPPSAFPSMHGCFASSNAERRLQPMLDSYLITNNDPFSPQNARREGGRVFLWGAHGPGLG